MSIQNVGVSGDVSAVEIYAHPDGKGVMVQLCAPSASGPGFRMSATQILDKAITELTPSSLGSDPDHTRLTVVNEGYLDLAADVAQQPDYMITQNQAKYRTPLGIFVPAGYYFAMISPNTGSYIWAELIFDELL